MAKRTDIPRSPRDHHGIDDDTMMRILNLRTRQQAIRYCRRLERSGVLFRRELKGRTYSFWIRGAGLQSHYTLVELKAAEKRIQRSDCWSWEGNVQSTVVRHLVQRGYLIRSVADTATRQRGIDVQAEKSGKLMWVTVKGYPQRTARTDPSIQAAHWFKQAVFDIVEYRQRDKDVRLMLALPDFPRYRALAQRVAWLKTAADFAYYWVRPAGTVLAE